MSGYVEIPLETMRKFLESQGFIMHKRDANTEWVANKIFVAGGINYLIRVDTSINPDDKSRGVGSDAIRVHVHLGSDGSWVFGTKRVNRTNLPNVEVDGKRQPILALCRNNAPLAKPCFELIRAGVNATIRGRDIGEGLIARIRNTKGTKMTEFLPNLKEWMMNEKSNLESIGKSIESLMDKYDTLMVLSEGCADTNELIAKIETIFSDKDSAVIFSTIHKSKGLESNIVYNLFFHKLMPSPYAVTEETQEQEKNLQYISVTRSKDILTFVEESKTLEGMGKIKN